MTTTTEPMTPERRSKVGRDPGRYAGVAFGVVFLAATTLWGLGIQVYDSDLETLRADSADDSTRTLSMVLSHLVMPLAAVLLLWTVARLRIALDAAAGRASAAGLVAQGSAVVLAVGFCILAAAQNVAILVAGGGYVDGFAADPAVGYGLALLSGYVGNATIWGGAAMMIAVGAAAWRSRLIPRWLIWLGYVTSPLLIVGWYYGLPVLLLAVWVAVAGLTVQTDRG
jgi:hypothetical protein